MHRNNVIIVLEKCTTQRTSKHGQQPLGHSIDSFKIVYDVSRVIVNGRQRRELKFTW